MDIGSVVKLRQLVRELRPWVRSSLGPGLGLTAEQGGGVERNPCLAVQEIAGWLAASGWQRSGEVGLLRGEAGHLGCASASPALCCSGESVFFLNNRTPFPQVPGLQLSGGPGTPPTEP